MEFDQYKKKTYTKYWNNFSEKPKNFIGTSIFFKKLKKYLNKPQQDEAYVSYPIVKLLNNIETP